MLDLTAYQEHLRVQNASHNTIECRVDFAHRIAARWPDLTAVTADDLAAFIAQPGYSRWTLATYDTHTRAFFRWLARTGQIDADPTLDLTRPKTPANRPRPLTALEAKTALMAADPDLRLALLLGMYAGLRVFEAAKVHSRDVTQDDLYVLGKGAVPHVLPVHPLIWEQAQTRGPGYWFPSARGAAHVRAETITQRTTRLFGSLGIAGSFHRCRHYYGTSLVRAGVNLRVVQVLMRHTNLSTTAAYLGVDEHEKRAGVNALGVDLGDAA